VRCGEPEIGISDSAAKTSDGAAQEREKRVFGRRRGGADFKGLPETWCFSIPRPLKHDFLSSIKYIFRKQL
jgi:hypothetical protein